MSQHALQGLLGGAGYHPAPYDAMSVQQQMQRYLSQQYAAALDTNSPADGVLLLIEADYGHQ